jgi:hypothetical protein
MAACASAIFVAAIVTPQPARAADPSNRVQLQVFQVKVVDVKGVQGQLPVTVYIDTRDRNASTDVCAVAPRIRDALNTYLRKETYKLNEKGNLADTARMSAGARPIVDSTAKAENIVNVDVKQGAPAVKASAAAMFQKSGCIGVADAQEQPKGAPKAEGGGEHH